MVPPTSLPICFGALSFPEFRYKALVSAFPIGREGFMNEQPGRRPESRRSQAELAPLNCDIHRSDPAHEKNPAGDGDGQSLVSTCTDRRRDGRTRGLGLACRGWSDEAPRPVSASADPRVATTLCFTDAGILGRGWHRRDRAATEPEPIPNPSGAGNPLLDPEPAI